jgi:hypothetical protein
MLRIQNTLRPELKTVIMMNSTILEHVRHVSDVQKVEYAQKTATFEMTESARTDPSLSDRYAPSVNSMLL